MKIVRIALALALGSCATLTQGAQPFDAAAAFGTRPNVSDVSLSPDGLSVAYIVAMQGQAAALYTRRLVDGAKSRAALAVNGKPDRLDGCSWVSNDRLVCTIWGVARVNTELLPFSRMWAVNAAPSPLLMAMPFSAVVTTHWASRNMVWASTGPARACARRRSRARTSAATRR